MAWHSINSGARQALLFPSVLGRLAVLKTGVVFLFTLGMAQTLAEETSDVDSAFDAEMLRQRGIDPRLAEYFNVAARFTPGDHRVRLTVNGRARGLVTGHFDQQGHLCFDAALLQAAGLILPDRAGDAPACEAFIAEFPLTQVQLSPQTNEVEILVPGQALHKAPRDISGFSSGGVAGILNYEMLGMANRFQQGSNNNRSLNTEAGFNAGDWIVRSHQLYSASSGQSRMQHLNAYAQRTFTGIDSVFQVGQIQLSNPVLGGAQINGVQLQSEQALSLLSNHARVEGLAQGPARVEVRQAGTLIYTTLVPGGPFSLSDVPRINQRSSLEVRVIEADGSQHDFSVSAAQAGIDALSNGYVLGVGQLRNVGNAPQTTVASAGWTGSLGARSNISGGALAANGYGSLGASLGFKPWQEAQARGDLVGTHASDEGVRGLQSRLALSQNLGRNWSLNGALTRQTLGYRELLDTRHLPDNAQTRSRTRDQWDAGASWSHDKLGSFSTHYSQASLFDGSTSRRASASWGTRYQRASISVTAERDLGGSSNSGNALYASISLPLGERRRLRTSLRDSNGAQRLGVSLDESLSETFSYRLGTERNLTRHSNGLTAGASMLPRYAQVDLGYFGDGDQQHSITGGVRGGLVVHGSGVTPSAYPVSDTFALIKVGELGGARLNTPSGPSWTDTKGRAVVARLNPYASNTVEVAPQSLPRNIEILEGVTQIKAGRGAVEHIDFSVEVTRRVLLDITTESGATLPAGAAVTDAHDLPVGLVDQGGQVFLANALGLTRLWVSGPDLPRCELQFELPKDPDIEAYYETVPAVCRAS